jgi:hypothetical protein
MPSKHVFMSAAMKVAENKIAFPVVLSFCDNISFSITIQHTLTINGCGEGLMR